VQDEIAATRQELTGRVGAEELALFDAYSMLLADRALSGEVVTRIREGNWAQGALSQVVLEHVRTFELMEDAYIRERGTDIRDLGRRVLAQLQAGVRETTSYPARCILIGEEIPASALADVPRTSLAGIVSVSGSGNSHVAILARSLGLPAIVGLRGAVAALQGGERVILDGSTGMLLVGPTDAEVAAATERAAAELEAYAALADLTAAEAVTLDGTAITLRANVDLPEEATAAAELESSCVCSPMK
jgi:phosphotransferase system enzyme I (PtsP)